MSSNFYRLSSSFWSKAAVALATLFAVLVAPLANVLPAYAATGINRQIAYQAKLLDTSGSPVADGTYQVRLSIYDAATAGTRLWTANGTTVTPTALNVSVVNGLFTVYLGDTSVAGGSQNSLDDTVLWNSDNLYLGVTIGVDAEMTPRKRLSASPYAFNAERLQGMYASSSAFGTSSVFTLNQTSNTSATGTRSTLEVRSQGTSNQNDFLIRGINDTNTPVFTINRQGNVTTTGNVVVSGDLTATNASLTTLLVGGQLPCLANGTNCLPGGSSSTPTLQQVLNQGNTATTTMQFGGGTSTGNFVTTNLNVTGTATTTNLIATNGTSTNFFATTASSTNLNALNLTAANVNVLGGTAILSSATSTQLIFTNATGSVLSLTTLTATNGTITNVTSTNLVATNGALTNVTWTNATGTNSTSTNFFATNLTGTSASFTNLLVSGKLACLADGTNCMVSGSATPTLDQVLTQGNTSAQSLQVGGITATNGTTTNVTSTNLFAATVSSTNLTALNLSANNVTILNGTANFNMVTSTRLFATNVTGTYASFTDFNSLTANNISATPASGRAIAVGKNRIFASDNSSNFHYFDASNPDTPSYISSVGYSVFTNDMAVVGNYLYAAANESVYIVDLHAQGAVTSSVSLLVGDLNYGITVQGNIAFIAASTTGLKIVDVTSKTAAARLLSTLNTAGAANKVAVNDQYAYIADGSGGLVVANISNPSTPTTTAILATADSVNDVAIAGRYAYLAEGSVGLRIVDISSPSAPSAVGTYNTPGSARSVVVNEHYAFVADATGGLLVIDISTPTSPVLVKTVAANTSVIDLALSGDNIYYLDNGMRQIKLPSLQAIGANIASTRIGSALVTKNLEVAGEINTQGSLSVGSYAEFNKSIIGKGDIRSAIDNVEGFQLYSSSTEVYGPLRMSDGYILMNTGAGIDIYDVSTSSMRIYNVTSTGTGILDIKGNRIYGIFGGIFYTLEIRDGVVNTVGNSSIPGVNEIVVDGINLYARNGTTLELYNIANPSNAYYVGQVLGSFNVNSRYKVINKRLYVYDASAGSVQVYDVSSNALNPTLLANFATASGGGSGDLFVEGDFLYTRNFDVGSYQIRVYDTKNGFNLASQYSMTGTVDGMAVVGNYVFIGAYSGGDNSVHVVDFTNKSMPRLVGKILTDHNNSSLQILASGGKIAIYNLTRQKMYVYRMSEINAPVARVSEFVAQNANVNNMLTVRGDIISNGNLTVSGDVVANGGMVIGSVSSTINTAGVFTNHGNNTQATTWGAYIDKLLVGPTSTATGTANYVSVFTYNGGSQSGLCLDNLATVATCLTTAGVSIRADDAINGTAFDLAEWYRITGSATATDLLIVDNTTSTKLKVSDGTPYDPRLIGIASTKPGFLLGDNGDIQLALAGRVPTKFSAINGSVAPGDFLTSSPFPGYAMKATKPGMIVGYALEASSGTSTIEVFVKPGYSAGTVLSVVGNESTVKDNLVFVATSTADAANQAVDSFGLTFRGSAWNASSSSAISSDFNFFNHVINATNSRLTLTNSSGTNLFTIAQNGDLSVTGRFFPAARSGAQDKTYLFVDDTMGPTSTYMATNADGWQTNDTYDFAERYYSPEPLEAGEVVTLSQTGQFHVQRAASSTEMTMGIVSTRPGFVTGRPASSTYPIALAGRVPTKVSSMNGAIHIGDPLGPSTIPGVAVKVTQQGPMIGYAMEEYNDAAVGLIEVFVEGGWYGKRVAEAPVAPSIINNNTTIINQVSTSHKGFAKIVAGAKKVTVTFASLNAFPNVQVQPRGQVIGGYYTDDYTDTSFTINMNEVQTRDVTFSWLVTATTEGDQVFLSDGTKAPVNTMTGQTAEGSDPAEESEQEAQPVVEEPVSEPTPSVEPTSSSTQETISSVDMPMSTSTEVTTSTQE